MAEKRVKSERTQRSERPERGQGPPAPRLVKPEKADLEKLSGDIQNQITALQNESKDIKKRMDNLLNSRTGAKNELDAARSIMQILLNEKKQLLDEKNALNTARESTRERINSRINEEKNARSELKFSNIESIDSQIRELEARQARTTMSLQDEKKILKDIHNLQMSKKTVASLSDMKAAIELLKQQKNELDRNFNEKSNQVKSVLDRIAAQRTVLDELNKDNTQNREAIPGFKTRLGEIKKSIDDKYQEIKTLRAEFKSKEDAYYAALAEERQRRKEQKQKEIEAKKAEEEAQRKAEEEEELKRIPYEDELNLCDYLVTYLESNFMPSTTQPEVTTVSAAPSTSSFDGLKVLVRTEEDFSQVTIQKKKNKKRGGGNQLKETITHGVDTLESFSLLEVTPPTTVSSVSAAIDALKAKKSYYQGLERGAVESIASKLKSEREKNASNEAKKSNKKSVFNLEVDFPDLAIAPVIEATPVNEAT